MSERPTGVSSLERSTSSAPALHLGLAACCLPALQRSSASPPAHQRFTSARRVLSSSAPALQRPPPALQRSSAPALQRSAASAGELGRVTNNGCGRLRPQRAWRLCALAFHSSRLGVFAPWRSILLGLASLRLGVPPLLGVASLRLGVPPLLGLAFHPPSPAVHFSRAVPPSPGVGYCGFLRSFTILRTALMSFGERTPRNGVSARTP